MMICFAFFSEYFMCFVFGLAFVAGPSSPDLLLLTARVGSCGLCTHSSSENGVAATDYHLGGQRVVRSLTQQNSHTKFKSRTLARD